MKKSVLFLLFLGLSVFAGAQCSNQGTLQATIVPSTAWQTIVTKSNQYLQFTGIAGNVYIFSYCSCDGGNMTYAGELSLDSSTTYVNGNFTDVNTSSGFCAGSNNSPQITWRCFSNGTYKLLTTHSGCALTAGTTATLAYIMITPSLCYSVASMAWAPDSYSTGTIPIGAGVDDATCTAVPIGFNFCFNGTYYDSCMITTNGNLIFMGNGCPYFSESHVNGFPSSSYTVESLPFTDNTYTAFSVAPGVAFPWQDAYNPAGGTIKYKLYGAAPNRHFTVAYDAVPLFLCNNLHLTAQVQIFETTNVIQIQTDSVPQCNTWGPGGQAVEGIVDATGFAAVIPPGRNHTNWVAGKEAWKFTPTCCTVLPVSLLGFQCQNAPKGIELDWSSGSETNNRIFMVERSADGNNFTTIATVPGAGNSETTRYYKYTDTVPLNGNNYYRLSQMDFDGKSQTYNVTSCTYNGGLLPGNIYPNPNYGSFTLTLGPSQFGQNIKVYDVTGRVVFTQPYPASNEITANTITLSVNPGVYFLNISNDSQAPIVKRLIVK